jgi:hypothetical protein
VYVQRFKGLSGASVMMNIVISIVSKVWPSISKNTFGQLHLLTEAHINTLLWVALHSSGV